MHIAHFQQSADFNPLSSSGLSPKVRWLHSSVRNATQIQYATNAVHAPPPRHHWYYSEWIENGIHFTARPLHGIEKSFHHDHDATTMSFRTAPTPSIPRAVVAPLSAHPVCSHVASSTRPPNPDGVHPAIPDESIEFPHVSTHRTRIRPKARPTQASGGAWWRHSAGYSRLPRPCIVRALLLVVGAC